MCTAAVGRNSLCFFHPSTRKQRSKRYRLQIHRLKRSKRSESKIGMHLKLKNLKLYMENVTILEENEKLRKKANLLRQENLALMSEFHKKPST